MTSPAQRREKIYRAALKRMANDLVSHDGTVCCDGDCGWPKEAGHSSECKASQAADALAAADAIQDACQVCIDRAHQGMALGLCREHRQGHAIPDAPTFETLVSRVGDLPTTGLASVESPPVPSPDEEAGEAEARRCLEAAIAKHAVRPAVPDAPTCPTCKGVGFAQFNCSDGFHAPVPSRAELIELMARVEAGWRVDMGKVLDALIKVGAVRL
jgi:hypothetical protein